MINNFNVLNEERELRLDILLSNRFKEHSRSYLQHLISDGQVLINGDKVKKREKCKVGDKIQITFLEKQQIDLSPKKIDIDILYEDDYLLIVNKPSGLVVHPGTKNLTDTFVNALVYHLNGTPQCGDENRPGIVHRLDKDTSGVMIAVKDPKCHKKLSAMFKEHKIEKHYLAICKGVPKQVGDIQTLIGRHTTKRNKMCVKSENGKLAHTHIEILSHSNTMSLILAKPTTGRTHQIRVHLKYLQSPVIGDVIYGDKKETCSRLMLHAHKIIFLHPITEQRINVIAPLPEEFRQKMPKSSMKNG